MKKLIIVRHAKSDWGQTGQPDKLRPLNERGKRDAPMMGERLLHKGELPDHILSSTATRAEQTTKLLCKGMGHPENIIQWDDSLYHASPSTIWRSIALTHDAVNYLMVVCHNPGITEFVNQLAGSLTDNMPTCGMACFAIDTTTWSQAQGQPAKLLFYDFPKNAVY
jgi:Phosphohistidine phosphatase SixA